MAAKRKQNHFLAFAILVGAIAISGSLVFLGLQMDGGNVKADVVEALTDFVQNGPPQAEPEAAEPADKPEIDMEEAMGDGPVLGDPDAPVTIVEFSDFECPYCSRFYAQTYPLIKENYVDTGKVKFVYRDFPLSSHARAYPSALAAECTRDQEGDEGYYQMHDAIFEGQLENGRDGMSDESLFAYAEEIGVDMGEFRTCFENDKFEEEIYAEMSEAGKYGITGTPSFIINGEMIVGAYPYADFERIIEKALAE